MSFVSRIHNDDFNVLWENCKADILSEDAFPWSSYRATTEEEKRKLYALCLNYMHLNQIEL